MKSETAALGSPPLEFRCRNGVGIWSAAVAVITNCRCLAAREPSTPLRVLSLMAMDAALRSRGLSFTAGRRQAVIKAMELGAILNDRFDGVSFDARELRAHVASLASSPFREVVWCYAKRLRRLERTRPDPADGLGLTMRYRENVNRVSLALLWALASGSDLSAAEGALGVETDLHLMFRLVMQMQMIDDLLDERCDRRRGLPSFVTAAGANGLSLRAIARGYADLQPFCTCRNFPLRLALRITAVATRALIVLRFRMSNATRAVSGSRG